MNDLKQYEENAREWWKENGRFRPLYHMNKPRFEFFDRTVKNWKGKQVLDVGCGGGYSCEFLAQRQSIISGIDLSPSSIMEAQKHASMNGLVIDYCQGDAQSLPYPDNHFDKVLCVDVLEHIENPAKAIAEMTRVLKPGGYFLYDTINRNFFTRFFFIWILENLLDVIPKNTHDFRLFIRPQEMQHYLAQSGLTLRDSAGLCPIGWSFKNHSPIFRLVPYTCAFYLGVAQKP